MIHHVNTLKDKEGQHDHFSRKEFYPKKEFLHVKYPGETKDSRKFPQHIKSELEQLLQATILYSNCSAIFSLVTYQNQGICKG